MKLTSKFFKAFLPLRSLQVSFLLLQNLFNNGRNGNIFLWFNKYLKYKGKPLYYKEFSNSGIVDARQLVDANGNFRSYDDIAAACNLTSNNESFIKYIQLMSAVQKNWNLYSVYIDNKNQIIENVLEKLQLFRKSSKSCYNYIFSKLNFIPAKQQLHWNQDLNISLNSDDWLDIYKSNYTTTQETKLRSFQINLNLRAIVTNVALHDFELLYTDKCIFCDKEPETLFHFFLHMYKNCSILEKCNKLDRIKIKNQNNLYPVNMLFCFKSEHKLFCFKFFIIASPFPNCSL